MAASPDEILAMITFARVVESGSFTAAAQKLGVSKSVVSARVAALERELDATLLQRTTRKSSLTPEGAALYERCARILVAADDAALALAGAGAEPRGVLRVNAPIVFAEEYLAAPIARYLSTYPDMRVDLALNDRVVDLVEEGVDVAIRISARLVGRGLVARKLATDKPVLCAAPAYLARRGTPSSAEELVNHDCLAYSLVRVSDEWRFRAAGSQEAFAIPIQPRFFAASGAVLRRAALAGMGLTVLPTFMVAADLAAGRLRAVLDTLHTPALGIHAVYPQAQRVPRKVRAFVDLLGAHFKTPPWRAASGAGSR